MVYNGLLLTGEETVNIFVLHESPAVCATMHCDKHAVKMIVEYAQLLASAHRILDGAAGDLDLGSKKGLAKYPWKLSIEKIQPEIPLLTHPNHPCSVWARATTENYYWLLALYDSLAYEYTLRYGREHGAYRYSNHFQTPPVNLPEGPRLEFPLAMPEQYKIPGDAVASYRAYYVGDKSRFATWKGRPAPTWFSNQTTSKLTIA